MTDNKILLVDDDEAITELLALHLNQSGYEVDTANNGQAALEKLKATAKAYGLIISDVTMPEMDGYELCQQVREDNSIAHIPFVFISARDTLEEMNKGLEVGGDDYLTKPVSPDEVIVKTKTILESYQKHQNLNQQLSQSFKTAMQAMSYSGNLGSVLQFLKSSLSIWDLDGLSKAVFETMQSFGLNSIIQYHINGQIYNFGPNGSVSPLEANVVELTRKKPRFFDFGARTAINYKGFTLLIKNMPIDEPEKYGTLKDVLGNFCDAIEARLQIIMSRNANEERTQVLVALNETFDEVEKNFQKIQKANISAIEDLSEDIEEAMLSLGLTESQEERIRAIVQGCLDKTNGIFMVGNQLGSKFMSIHETLEKILK